jgi:hypothetical protein
MTYDMKKLKIKNWTSWIAVIGSYMLRRPKHSEIEVVVPKEEEGEINFINICHFLIASMSQAFSTFKEMLTARDKIRNA